jgi:hypothetical protein
MPCSSLHIHIYICHITHTTHIHNTYSQYIYTTHTYTHNTYTTHIRNTYTQHTHIHTTHIYTQYTYRHNTYTTHIFATFTHKTPGEDPRKVTESARIYSDDIALLLTRRGDNRRSITRIGTPIDRRIEGKGRVRVL